MATIRRNIYDINSGYPCLVLSVVQDDPDLMPVTANRYFYDFRTVELKQACDGDGIGSTGSGFNGVKPAASGEDGEAFFDALEDVSTQFGSPSTLSFVNYGSFTGLVRQDINESLLDLL